MLKKVLVTVLVSLALFVETGTAQNLDPQPFKFSFLPTEGAGGYLAEVQDLEGNSVAKQQVTAVISSITFKLTPGNYQLKMTTLDRLLQPAASTDWLPIHVAAAAPPVVGSVPSTRLVPGQVTTLAIPAKGLAPDAAASLTTPSGVTIALPMPAPHDGLLALPLPPVTERGEYSLLLTNPPKLTTTLAGVISVHYPQPLVEQLDPLTVTHGEVAQALRVTGKNFSKEAVVVVQGRGGQQVLLPINERSETSLTAVLPPSVGVDDYQVLVANAPDEFPVTLNRKLSVVALAASSEPKFEAVVKSKGNLAISSITGGSVMLLGQSVSLPQGSTLPVKDLEIGDLPLQMTYADGKTQSVIVNVKAGETTSVVFEEKNDVVLPELTLQKAAAEKHGILDLREVPQDWRVTVNGDLIGTTPMRELLVRSGQVDVKLETPGRSPVSLSFDLPSNDIVPVQWGLDASRHWELEDRKIGPVIFTKDKEWDGLNPIWNLPKGWTTFLGTTDYNLHRIWLCRDENKLRWNVEFADKNPFGKNPKEILRRLKISLRIQDERGSVLELGTFLEKDTVLLSEQLGYQNSSDSPSKPLPGEFSHRWLIRDKTVQGSIDLSWLRQFSQGLSRVSFVVENEDSSGNSSGDNRTVTPWKFVDLGL